MVTETARPSLREAGYRRLILALGACWGSAPALSLGLEMLAPLSTRAGLLALGAAATLSLGVLYELDSRTLDRRGDGVPLAWAYSLVAPLSAVAWLILGPTLVQLPGLGLLGLLVGPPASALLYVWQRGRCASVGRPPEGN